MRILYLNSIETNAGWGVECFIQNAFKALGHTSYSIDHLKYRYRLYPQLLKAPSCDALFVQKGSGIPLDAIRAIRAPRLIWACDVLGSKPGQPLEEQDPVYDRTQYPLLSSGLFDHIFVRTPNCMETVVSRGWIARERCTILRSGFDPSLHRTDPNTPKDIDVLFVASMTPRRRAMLAEIGKHFPITVASGFGPQMVDLVSRARIVLNIHAGPMLDTETRIYEVLGTGSFLLTERLSGDNPFSPDQLVQFGDMNDLREKLGYYLAHDRERETIAANGHAAALAGHTYVHRAKELVEVMSHLLEQKQGGPAPMLRKDLAFHAFGANEFGRFLGSRGKGLVRRVVRRRKPAATMAKALPPA